MLVPAPPGGMLFFEKKSPPPGAPSPKNQPPGYRVLGINPNRYSWSTYVPVTHVFPHCTGAFRSASTFRKCSRLITVFTFYVVAGINARGISRRRQVTLSNRDRRRDEKDLEKRVDDRWPQATRLDQ